MIAPVALVQGASRGLGLQFCKSILRRLDNSSVVATCRSPNTATDLEALKQEYGARLHVCKLDVWNEKDMADTAEFLKKTVERVDLLINCSAILHPSKRGETSLKDVTFQGLQETMATNAFGPLLMAKHFSPLLARSSGVIGQQTDKKPHAGVLVNISAKVGSISDNGLGGWYSYRMSKAALNMATKNISIELGRGKHRVISVTLHPGTVDTELSRPYHKNVPDKNLFSPEYSVECLMNVIDSLTVEDTGKFFNYEKVQLPF